METIADHVVPIVDFRLKALRLAGPLRRSLVAWVTEALVTLWELDPGLAAPRAERLRRLIHGD